MIPTKGVIIFCRVMEGTVKKGYHDPHDGYRSEGRGRGGRLFRAGQFIPCDELSAGMVGYITASIKNVKDTAVGDTVTDDNNPCAEPLPGYKRYSPWYIVDYIPQTVPSTGSERCAGEVTVERCVPVL